MNPAPLDGNAAAGDLADAFAFDVTVTTCATCHHAHPMAALRAYMQAPGLVLRCCSCDSVQARFVRSPDRAWLDMHGIELVEIAVPHGRDAS